LKIIIPPDSFSIWREDKRHLPQYRLFWVTILVNNFYRWTAFLTQ